MVVPVSPSGDCVPGALQLQPLDELDPPPR